MIFCIFKKILYIWIMDKEMMFVVSFYWLISAAYVIHYDYKRNEISVFSVFLAFLLGPLIALIVKDNIKEQKKYHYIEENENDRHKRWFRAISEINRQRIPDYGRTIPPPPPISRVERAMSERDEAIRTTIERTSKNKLRDFKFLKG